ncbi:MAG: class D beta-lactamase [Anaerolineales bacterium]|nr:class D beta-lactamase [Anaerolineales bacterium]
MKHIFFKAFFVYWAAVLCGCSALPIEAAAEIRPDLGKHFAVRRLDGCFVLYDLKADHWIRYNPELCSKAYLPASTYKIPNALIALDSGVVASADTVLAWDGTKYGIPEWEQDQTMRTALRYSTVWYFQEMARRVGAERMQAYVEKIEYGNQEVSGNIDSFWLDGGLRISPDEQVLFLERLYLDQLPFSVEHMELVKEMLILEETDEYTLHAKTGWVLRARTQVGWWVGWVETKDNGYLFATSFESPEPIGVNGPAREEITRAILVELGILPVP